MAESIATSLNMSAGFPLDVYHPIFGKRTAKEFDDIRGLPGLLTDWFRTAADADAARTQPEADAVIAHNLALKIAEHAALSADPQGDPASRTPPDSAGHIVRDSVTAQMAADKLAVDVALAGGDAMGGPAAPPMVPASPGAADGIEPARDVARSPEDVAEETRRAAASDVIPEPGQAVDLAAGGHEAGEQAENADDTDDADGQKSGRRRKSAPPPDRPPSI